MQLVQLDMKQISSEAEIYDCLVGQMNFTNADEKPEWMNVIEMNERDPYEMDTEEQPEDPEFKENSGDTGEDIGWSGTDAGCPPGR